MKILNKLLCLIEVHGWCYDHQKKRTCKRCGKTELRLMVNDNWRQIFNENGWRYW